MKATLNFNISVRLSGFVADSVTTPLEVVCIFGTPTATPGAETEIPLTIKEMLIDGRPLDYTQREMMLKLIGGTEALKSQLKAI